MQFEYPDILRPEELDRYLAKGWFRMRQSIFTCDYLMRDHSVHSTLWLRLPLKDYNYTYSLRKLLNKNDRLMDVVLRPLSLTDEMEDLYQRYKDKFKGQLSDSLTSSLYDEESVDNIFDSWQFEVRLKGKLIAFSVFDKGEQSIESIKGIYDPDFGNYSLGIYTMLLEIRSAIQDRKKYYYPGYFAPGCRSFDYKLRLGPMEYLDRKNGWTPLEELDVSSVASVAAEEAMKSLVQALEPLSHPVYWTLSPAFRIIPIDRRLQGCISSPLYISFGGDSNNELIVTWNLKKEVYQLTLCRVIAHIRREISHDGIYSEPAPPSLNVLHTNEILHPIEELGEFTNPADMLPLLEIILDKK